jgi:hypothetical protein
MVAAARSSPPVELKAVNFEVRSVRDATGKWYNNTASISFEVSLAKDHRLKRVRVSPRIGGNNEAFPDLPSGSLKYSASKQTRSQAKPTPAPSGNTAATITIFYQRADGREEKRDILITPRVS